MPGAARGDARPQDRTNAHTSPAAPAHRPRLRRRLARTAAILLRAGGRLSEVSLCTHACGRGRHHGLRRQARVGTHWTTYKHLMSAGSRQHTSKQSRPIDAHESSSSSLRVLVLVDGVAGLRAGSASAHAPSPSISDAHACESVRNPAAECSGHCGSGSYAGPLLRSSGVFRTISSALPAMAFPQFLELGPPHSFLPFSSCRQVRETSACRAPRTQIAGGESALQSEAHVGLRPIESASRRATFERHWHCGTALRLRAGAC